jgi:hypothetical protein
LEELPNKFANVSKTNFESIQNTVANQGVTIKSLETQIGQLSKLVTPHISKDIAGNTVDNPKDECKTLKEQKIERTRNEEELMEFKKWFTMLGMTLEEAYDEFTSELEEYRESLARGPQLPPKKRDPGSVTIICHIGKEGVKALCDVGSSVNVMPLSLADKLKLTTINAGTTR